MEHKKCITYLSLVTISFIVFVTYHFGSNQLRFMALTNRSNLISGLRVTRRAIIETQQEQINVCVRSFLNTQNLWTNSSKIKQEASKAYFYRSYKENPISYDYLTKECVAVLYNKQADTEMKQFENKCFYPFQLSSSDKKEIQQVLAQLKRNFEAAGLQLILTGGSVIGSHRYHGMIPYDDDIDFQIPYDEKAQARKVLEAVPGTIFRNTEDINQHWKLAVVCKNTRNWNSCRVQIDFFFFWFDTNRTKQKMLEYPNSFPIQTVFPPRWRPFEGTVFLAPHDFPDYLWRQYGSDVDHCKFSNHNTMDRLDNCPKPMVSCQKLHYRYPYTVTAHYPQLLGGLEVELVVDGPVVTGIFMSP